MEFREPIKILAVRDRDIEALERAASGGAFSVLARPIIEAKGVVFGARMFDGGEVRHVAARSLDEVSTLQGSAYVQSDTSGVYCEVANAVQAGIPTLFVGTPCQCAAVVSYLKARKSIVDLESCNNLIVCDLICHGVPNAELFHSYQVWLARKCRTDDGVHSFKFRTKRNGWGLYYYYYYYYRNGRKHEVCEPGDYDPYYASFLRGETYRECCYRCPFARRERVTDFTIGDYWGIESIHPDFYNSKGVSVVLVNTEKALHYFDDYAAMGCDHILSDLDSAVRENHNLNAPTKRPISRDSFLVAIEQRRVEGDMDVLFDKDLKPKKSVKRFVKRLLPAGTFSALKRAVKMVTR